MSGNRKYIQLDLDDVKAITHYVETYFPYFPGDSRKVKLVKALTEMVNRVHDLGGQEKVYICLANAVRRRS